MWWIIGGIVLVVILFIGWIVWEFLHIPLDQDLFDDLVYINDDYIDEDDVKNRGERASLEDGENSIS